MDLWQALLKQALLGTERQKEVLRAEGALGEVLKRVFPEAVSHQRIDREHAMLDAAAVVAAYWRCGQIPTPIPRSLPAPSEPECCPVVSPRSAVHLEIMLTDSSRRCLLPEWLAAVAAAGERVPAFALPQLLDVGGQDRSLRGSIVDVIGNRGRWLATLNSDWGYATGTPDSESDEASGWEDGEHAARVLILERLRQTDPHRARALVEAAWKTERARERAAFLESFKTGLSMADEPFLEACLDDKSKEVRRQAADLLTCLGESRLCLRMQERVKPLLRYQSKQGVLSKLTGQTGVLEVVLPDTHDAAMDRDGIIEQAPPGQGQKAWWMEQMLATVPPALWTRTWAVSPEDIVRSAQQSEWSPLLLSAWGRATLRHKDVTWAEALLQVEPTWGFWSFIPQTRREALFEVQLAKIRGIDERRQLLERVAAFDGAWSDAFAQTMAHVLRDLMEDFPILTGYLFRAIFQACALRMSPEAAESVERLWSKQLREETSWTTVVVEAIEMLRFRRDVLKAISESVGETKSYDDISK